MMPTIKLLIRVGLQSLLAHKTKSLIVGGLMMFGAFIVVVSLALLDSVERSTRASLVESITGDFQLYDKNAKDKFALFGGIGFGTEEIGEVPSFAALRTAVDGMPNIKAVIPMGVANASVYAQGDLDRTLNELRKMVGKGQMADAQQLFERVRTIAQVLRDQQAKTAAVKNTVVVDSSDILAEALSPAMAERFAQDPVKALDWLDVKLGPLGEQGNAFFLRLVGTDLDAYQKTFNKVRIVEGTAVPPGTRGVLVGKAFLEKRVKFGVALNLDAVQNERAKGNTIAGTKTMQEGVSKAKRQASRVVYMLAPKDIGTVRAAIDAELGATKKDGDFTAVMEQFLDFNDDNFDRRYKLFYDVIAPRIQLYPFVAGDTLTLTSFTKSGYIKSINVKVYGIYTIDGLESSDLAGVLSLTDLNTFRELYGQRTAELDAELKAMKENSGAKAIDRGNAEDALFGDDAAVTITEAKTSSGDGRIERVQRQEETTFDVEKTNQGLVLSAAVLLKDPSQAKATRAALTEKLAPLNIQVADWQEATGFIGQLVMVVRAVLLGAIFLLFLVTIVILNNSLVMATLERVAEFGTLRAIGAQKGFVNAMVVFETAVLGAIAGTAGALLGVAFISWLHSVGVPAPATILQALFGGPRMYPTVSASNIIAGLAATFVVSVLATLYPARLAMKVQPIVAMQGKE
jgi:ABC-type lipoprotein release transport system permease subunit